MKKILDVCCGSKMFWFDKKNPNVVFNDIRNESHELCDGRKLEITPDFRDDFRRLGFQSESFKLVIFDPPHLKVAGEKSYMAKKYGKLNESWREDIAAGFRECLRVLDQFGVLVFKWNETQIPVSEVIKIVGQEPLLGHKSGKNSKTHWLLFMKLPNTALQQALRTANNN